MKIYFIPYTLKTYLSETKFHSGIDVSMMSTMKLVSAMGHDTRVFALASNLDETKHNVFIYNKDLEASGVKAYYKTRRKEILESLYADIIKYKPDLIFSNHDVNSVYSKLTSIVDVPIIYQNQTMPGFFTDLNNANLFYKLTRRSIYALCVSDFHKTKFEKYYAKTRSEWDFDELKADDVLHSIYTEQKHIAKVSDDIIRHVSAMNPGKKTFGIHEFLSGTEYKSEVFTTTAYLSSDEKIKEYGKKNLAKFASDPLRVTLFDQPHDVIMNHISTSLCTFVGLAPYDTFTITSFESLVRGVPLIVFGTKENNHPALEMCDDVMKKRYIRVVRTKQEFIKAVAEFSNLTITDRQDLADRAYAQNSDINFKHKLETIFAAAITKHATVVEEDNIERFFGT